jgi:hypothetical protein|tara:strand:- start:50 stop:580 length:531 start_codon:yes stop_codon:yes gene_type:complete
MQYLYHRVPPNMDSSTLYPLNKLKNTNPAIYAERIKKYKGREFVMEQRIPTLDCLWNDVIHLSAVHPQKIENELKKFGSALRGRKFFQIDPNLLEPKNTTVYLFKQTDSKDKFVPENWTEYNPNDLEKYNKPSNKTIDYYKRTLAEGERPLLWLFIPHILYKGSIDTSKLKIIEVE